MIDLYKAHLLPYLEYRTAAIYHATREVLAKLDRIQTRFLEDIGVVELAASMEFNLAPLAARRDMAMLGVIHRTVIRRGPSHFQEFFRPAASGQLLDPRQTIGGELVKRSALGLTAVYNLLPEIDKACRDVKTFQSRLQNPMKQRAVDGCEDWPSTFSPRVPLQRHPLA